MEGGKSIPKYLTIKKFLKGFVAFLFIACGYLYASDKTAFITILANLMGLVMSIGKPEQGASDASYSVLISRPSSQLSGSAAEGSAR